MDNSAFIFGVDLDGVVADFYGQMRRIAAEWLNKPLSGLTEDVSYGLNEWELDAFGGYDALHHFAVTQRDLYRNMQPIQDAPAIMRKLSNKGIRIRIITHRLFIKHEHKTSITQTVDWLDHYDIPYWDLCFMNDKGAVGAHVYIDDAPQNISSLRNNGCNTIVFSNSTNKEMAGPRAKNWQEVEALVMRSREEWRTGTRDLFY
jgi:5'(3')-deoxyribonucleotidase